MTRLIVRTPAVVLLMLFFAASCVYAHDVQTKPVVEQEVLPLVPETFMDLWDSSDVVARVRIDASHVEGVGTTPLVVTEHRARALRVFKGSLRAGQTITFAQSAGDLELPTKTIHVAGAVPLQTGFEYVVFLRKWPAGGAYTLTGDRSGAFKIVNGIVQPQGGGKIADEHRNLAERRFIDELEHAAARRREMR